jgi:hypothetical protein
LGEKEGKRSSIRGMEANFGWKRGKEVLHKGDGGPFWVEKRKRGPP